MPIDDLLPCVLQVCAAVLPCEKGGDVAAVEAVDVSTLDEVVVVKREGHKRAPFLAGSYGSRIGGDSV